MRAALSIIAVCLLVGSASSCDPSPSAHAAGVGATDPSDGVYCCAVGKMAACGNSWGSDATSVSALGNWSVCRDWLTWFSASSEYCVTDGGDPLRPIEAVGECARDVVEPATTL